MDSVLAGSSMDQFHVDVAITRRVSVSKWRNFGIQATAQGWVQHEKRCDGRSTQSRVIPASLSKNKIITP